MRTLMLASVLVFALQSVARSETPNEITTLPSANQKNDDGVMTDIQRRLKPIMDKVQDIDWKALRSQFDKLKSNGFKEILGMHEKILNKVRTGRAQLELKTIADAIRLSMVDGAPLPTDLPNYIKHHVSRSATVDPWGVEYEIFNDDYSAKLRSCGADKRCGTDDDVEMVIIETQQKY